MNKFAVNFKDDNEKKIVLLTLFLAIFFGWIALIITSFGLSNNLTDESKKIINAFLNFDLLLFIIIFAISIIPIIQFFSILVSPVLFFINLIIILKAISAINNNMKEIDIPVIFSIF